VHAPPWPAPTTCRLKVLDSIGINALIDQPEAGHSHFPTGERYGLALTLGGGEVSLVELTTAYAAFATRLPNRTYAVEKVTDASGTVLFQTPTRSPQFRYSAIPGLDRASPISSTIS